MESSWQNSTQFRFYEIFLDHIHFSTTKVKKAHITIYSPYTIGGGRLTENFIKEEGILPKFDRFWLLWYFLRHVGVSERKGEKAHISRNTLYRSR